MDWQPGTVYTQRPLIDPYLSDRGTSQSMELGDFWHRLFRRNLGSGSGTSRDGSPKDSGGTAQALYECPSVVCSSPMRRALETAELSLDRASAAADIVDGSEGVDATNRWASLRWVIVPVRCRVTPYRPACSHSRSPLLPLPKGHSPP
jgi:hypothetical protein